MAALGLFYRFMVRPFFREPVRTAVTILGIALGVAVVLAIDAATGFLRSSVETLSGVNSLEISASGDLLLRHLKVSWLERGRPSPG
jgi:hypothetical protein